MRSPQAITRLSLLLPVCLLAAGAVRACGGEDATAPSPKRKLDVQRLFKKLKLLPLPGGVKFSLRYPVKSGRRLRYDGTVSEVELARSGRRMVVVSNKTYAVQRIDLVDPLGTGLAQVWSYAESKLSAARQAGRDDLALFQQRPSGGVRLTAIMRRMGGRGLEPAGGDFSLQRQLSPVAEFPRLPARELSAEGRAARVHGDYLATWKLVSAALLEKRKCWVLSREVQLKPGSARGAAPVTARSEYLVSDGEFTVLGVTSRWTELGVRGGLVRERALELRLSEESSPKTAKLAAESARIEKSRELLRALSARDVNRAKRLLGEARSAGCPRAVLKLAARFAEAEKALGQASGGARRIELVPEDTFAFIRAPRNLDPKVKLRPVIFLHASAARAETYFKDWDKRAGKDPLMLIFPQARDWTWNAQADGAVIGSLLDVLGRTYSLDRKRLVLAGHDSGGELAMLLAYGAQFPGYRVRGVVSAGALMAEKIRRRAYDRKPAQLLARLRSVNVYLLNGLKNKKVRSDKVRNLASWLSSYNPGGVKLTFTPDVALRYATEWTPQMIAWIVALPAEPARRKKPAKNPAGR